MSTRRTRTHMRTARTEAFLRTKCFVCFDDPSAGIPSSRMPCCRQFAHETCLLDCFRHARARSLRPWQYQPSCPHCRAQLIPYNASGERPHVPEGAFEFGFQYVNYSGPVVTESERDDWFEQPGPPPSRPPALDWDVVRRNWEADRA